MTPENQPLRLAIAQLNPKIGDFSGNTQRILAAIETAKRQGAALIVFPELAVCGYFPRDLLDCEAFIQSNERAIVEIAAAARGPAVVCGFVERNSGPGRPYYNSTALLRDGRVEAIYRKHLLPFYDVFEEERYFEPGDKPLFFQIGGTRFALAVCEDVWNFPEFVSHPYRTQPLEALRNYSLDWVISPSASPFHLGKPAQRRSVFENAARFVGASLLLCNQVGGNDDLIFDGGSFALGADGGEKAQAAYFREDLVVFDAASPASPSSPRPARSESEWLLDALALGTADYARKNGFAKFCLGLSGGIDSSIVAAIAAAALGPSAVSGIALPTRYSSSASLEDARILAQNLTIDFRALPIEPLFRAFESVLPSLFGQAPLPLTLENIQPRIRMSLLMALSNQENRLLLNTSNKSEIATGYSTLYGDGAGALAVIGDLTKAQVYALADHLNRDRMVVPSRVITRPPTAELRENQTDQDSLPPYDRLDPIVRDAVEKSWESAALKRAGHDAKAVDRFAQLYSASEYKRQQFPPILRVSARAFGRGRRVPLAARKP